jgi:DNA-binding GntR family transcriptional regulator
MRKPATRKAAERLKGIRPVGKPRSVGDAVYDALKGAIIKGDLAPGQRLIEHQLSLQLKTSRIPIREAIKKLEQEGLVEKLHRRGFIVKSISQGEIEETFGIRAVLESYAAYLATERLTDVLIRKLEASIQDYRDGLASNDVETMMIANTQFHETIYRASGSQKLYTLINNFRDYISRYRKALLVSPNFARISLEDHVQMMHAMKAGDKVQVEELVRKHILRGKGIIIREMELGKLI